MSRRLSTQDCPQVHKRDLSRNSTACGPCGHPAPLITYTVAPLRHRVRNIGGSPVWRRAQLVPKRHKHKLREQAET
jgi:hypothetical protein